MDRSDDRVPVEIAGYQNAYCLIVENFSKQIGFKWLSVARHMTRKELVRIGFSNTVEDPGKSSNENLG